MDQTTIDLLLTYGLPLVVALAGVGYKWVMRKLSPLQQEQAQDAISTVVAAVEQLYVQSPGSGPAKKAEALKLAQGLLADLGLKVSVETLNVLIESAVRAMKQQDLVPSGVTA